MLNNLNNSSLPPHLPTQHRAFANVLSVVVVVVASTVPLAPVIIPEDCSAENNSVTVAWQAPSHSFVQGYVLELDDGNGGEFRVSVAGLHIFQLEFWGRQGNAVQCG